MKEYYSALNNLKKLIRDKLAKKVPIKDHFHSVIFPMLKSIKRRNTSSDALEQLEQIQEVAIYDFKKYLGSSPLKQKGFLDFSEASNAQNSEMSSSKQLSECSTMKMLSLPQEMQDSEINLKMKKYEHFPAKMGTKRSFNFGFF